MFGKGLQPLALVVEFVKDLEILYTIVESPLGEIFLARNDEGLTCISFQEGTRALRPEVHWRKANDAFNEERIQLAEYFNGALFEFDLALAPEGTPFQREAWRALHSIPYGETATYGEQARRIGRPSASRAVGAANGQNPLPIVIPCHRVVGANGKLTGYGGGLRFKEALLALERKHSSKGGAQLKML